MILLSRTEDCAREAVLVRRVRQMDGLEEHSSELLDRSIFAVRISLGAECATGEGQEGRLGGPGLHSTSGLRVVEVCRPTQGAVPVTHGPACRHSPHDPQVLIRHVYPVVYTLRLAEIERSPLDMKELIRTEMRVVLHTGVGFHLEEVLHDIASLASAHVEICVIGQVNHGRLVRYRIIFEPDHIIVSQPIGHICIHIAGKSLFPIRTETVEPHSHTSRLHDSLTFPDELVETLPATVSLDRFSPEFLIGIHLIPDSVQSEGGMVDTVSETADHRADKAVLLFE